MISTSSLARFHFYDAQRTNDGFSMVDLAEYIRIHGEQIQRPHLHRGYQIIWFRHASGKHYVDFRDYPVDNNTLFFISPGQIHQFDEHTEVDGILIQFDESFLSDECNSESVFLKYNIFNSFDAEPYFSVCMLCEQNLQRVLDGIVAEQQQADSFAHDEYLKFLVRMFLIEVQRLGQRGGGKQLEMSNIGNRFFVKFRQLLEHNYKQMHTVKEYASQLGVSAKSLTNYVQDAAHITPLMMINERILLEAKRLLQHSSMKVKEIAYDLGFEDPSYFVKFFKRQVGCLPVEFRDRDINN